MEIPAGYAQVNLIFTGAGVPRGAQVTFGVGGTLSAAALPATADLVANTWLARIAPRIPSTVTLSSVRVKLGPNDTGVAIERSYAHAGLKNTEVDSPQVTILVRKVTARGGRQGRGRMFHPGVEEGSTLSGGLFLASALASLITSFENFRTDLANAAVPMVLLHNDPLLLPDTITSLDVQQLVATQRRRLRKVGGRKRINP